jgi:hypothetical protein
MYVKLTIVVSAGDEWPLHYACLSEASTGSNLPPAFAGLSIGDENVLL